MNPKIAFIFLLISISTTKGQNIGDPCFSTDECTFTHSICLDDICQCNANSFPFPTGVSSCLPFANQIGNACEVKQQCRTLGNNGDTASYNCEGGSCQCAAGYVNSTLLDRCLRSRPDLDDQCQDDKQCMPENSFCGRTNQTDSGRCNCGQDFVEVINFENITQSICVEIQREINGTCQYDAQCHSQFGPGSMCFPAVAPPEPFRGRCRCWANFGSIYVPEENRCYEPRRLHQACNSNYECFFGINKHAICNPTTDRCECQPGCLESPLTDGWCYGNKTIGDDCSIVIGDCSLYIEGSVECDETSKTCTCTRGQIPTADGRACKSKPEKLDDSCIFNDHCSEIDENSFCNRVPTYEELGFCDCRSQFFKNFTGQTNQYKCVPNPKLIGEWCVDSGQCYEISKFSYCEESFSNLGWKYVCSCMGNSEPNSNFTACVVCCWSTHIFYHPAFYTGKLSS